MSNDNINNILEDNLQINDIQDINNENNFEDEDKSFNQMIKLQILLKKQSGLKELCKKIKLIIIII